MITLLTYACQSEVSRPGQQLDLAPGSATKYIDDKGDASAEAVFLNFVFEGEAKVRSSAWVKTEIEEQLLYTVGQLNGHRAVSRIDQLELEILETRMLDAGGLHVRYHAQLIVAWAYEGDPPKSYEFILPYDATYQGRQLFTERLLDRCVANEAHDVDEGSMWYYYRPLHDRCPLRHTDRLDEEEVEQPLPPVIRTTADVTPSQINTTGKYPEYHKVWEDQELRVVAIFGLAEAKSSSDLPQSWDAGFQAYRKFIRTVYDQLILGEGAETTITPVSPTEITPEHTDITLEGHLSDGRRVVVNALLVDQLHAAPPQFDERYQTLTPRADLIIYNGHAGLGANIRALARRGDWVQGQYAIVFMNGCDTYAYVDDAIFKAQANVNPDDPTGSKYVDVVTNAMPSYFFSMSEASLALFEALLHADDPLTYEQIFTRIDRSQVVLVTGEADNEFEPQSPSEEAAQPWTGLNETRQLTRGQAWELNTPMLEAGTYLFSMDGTGDADLHVRRGSAPTTDLFDCRPFKLNSVEACEVTLEGPNQIFVLIHGWGKSADVTLTAERISP